MKKLIPIFLAAIMLTGCHSDKGTSSAPVDKPVGTSAVTETAEATTEITAVSATVTASDITTTSTVTTTKPEETNTVKETYTAPEVEIVEFTTEDVITTSTGAMVNEDGSIELPIIKIK